MQNESEALLLSLLSTVGEWLAESVFSIKAINVQVVSGEGGTVNIALAVNTEERQE